MGTARFSLLRILADGKVHSGERIGRSLGLSRAEVGRVVRGLDELGLRVLAVRGRGYRLSRGVDLIDASSLAARLSETSPGLQVEVLDECSSTNTVLAERAAAGAAQGTALVCEYQSAGRGRRGKSWISAVGDSLTFSVLWRFSQGAGTLAGLSLAVAVVAANALERLGTHGVAVKWPNDLLCQERKLSGILIETSGNAAGPTTAIVGVGINVRLSRAARRRIGRAATGIAAHNAATPSRTALLVELLASIAAALEQFAREGFAPFRQEWVRRHLWQGRQVVVSQADKRVAEGKVIGVAEDGALVLSSMRGIESVHSGELSLGRG